MASKENSCTDLCLDNMQLTNKTCPWGHDLFLLIGKITQNRQSSLEEDSGDDHLKEDHLRDNHLVCPHQVEQRPQQTNKPSNMAECYQVTLKSKIAKYLKTKR